MTKRKTKCEIKNPDYAIIAEGLPRDIWQLTSQPKNTMRDVKWRLRNYRSSGFTPRHLATNVPTKNTMRDIK
ncbi:hypothetical protein, partial [Pseudoalteromonas sp. Q36-MNA-CIBAN-0048]|uniref:hypothetical protein n=1 Tax=Pseudoalteromonas sp. Q36-MNA-CIBAN-0048 TaxID=3140479 RepID=UPI00332177E5